MGPRDAEGKHDLPHVFDWPADGKLAVTGLGMGLKRAYLLGDAQQTSVAGDASGETITLTLPSSAPDAVDSVVVMECQWASAAADWNRHKRR